MSVGSILSIQTKIAYINSYRKISVLFLLFCVLVVVLVNGNDQECAGHRRKLALLNSLPSIWKTNILVSVFHHIDNCSEAKDISQEEDTQRS